jgi:hypothetical protein
VCLYLGVALSDAAGVRRARLAPQAQEATPLLRSREWFISDVSLHRNLASLLWDSSSSSTSNVEETTAATTDSFMNAKTGQKSCTKQSACRFLLFKGVKMHRVRYGSVVCEQGCLLASPSYYLKRGWSCGACGRSQPKPPPGPAPTKTKTITLAPMASTPKCPEPSPIARSAPLAPPTLAPVVVVGTGAAPNAAAPVPAVGTGPAPTTTTTINNQTVVVLAATPPQVAAAVSVYLSSLTTTTTISLTGSSPSDLALQWLATNPLPLNQTIALPLSPIVSVRLAQRFALLALWFAQAKSSSVGWTNATDWLSPTKHECYWYGVVCTPVQNGTLHIVTGLRLDGNNVGGPIPFELGLLTNMEFVTLNNNRLAGTLPSSLAAWTKLQTFRIGNNTLQGALPSELGASWPLVTYVQLNNNKFSGSLPTAIGAWQNLTYLTVHSNLFTGTIPNTVAKWTRLEKAYFQNNLFANTTTTMGLTVPMGLCRGGDGNASFLPKAWVTCPKSKVAPCPCCICA